MLAQLCFDVGLKGQTNWQHKVDRASLTHKHTLTETIAAGFAKYPFKQIVGPSDLQDGKVH